MLQATTTYPRAKIFVLSHPPLITPQSDVALTDALATVAGVSARAIEDLVGASLLPLAGVPPDPLLTGVAIIAGAVAHNAGHPEAYLQVASRHSALVHADEIAMIDAIVEQANVAAAKRAVLDRTLGRQNPLGYVTIVRLSIPFDDKTGYAAPNSYLWPVPTTQSHDDMFSQRQALCDAQVPLRGIAGLGDCLTAAAGFPNHDGANAIQSVLKMPLINLLSAWKNAYAPK